MSGMLVALVENRLGVRLLREQYVVEDTSDLVCSRSDRLGNPELRPDAPEELSKVTFCSAERVGPKPKGKGSAVRYFPSFARQHLTAADSLLWTKAQPRSKSGCVAEPAYVRTDFCEDDLGSDCTDSGNVGEVDTSDAIEFFPEIEAGILALALKSGMFGAARNGF